MDELVAAVAAASGEQSQGIQQVNAAVGRMNDVTRNNAASAEESASAVQELRGLAQAMRDAVQELARVLNGGAGQVADQEPVPAPTLPLAEEGSALPSPPRSASANALVQRGLRPHPRPAGSVVPADREAVR